MLYSQTSYMQTLLARIPLLRAVDSKSQLLSPILSMKCNSFSAKSSLNRGEILVPIPNIFSMDYPIGPNCRRRPWCENRYPRHNTFID